MYSIIEKTKTSYEIMVAYIDIKGNKTIDVLNKWESQDYANRQLYVVSNELQARILIQSL